MIGAIVKPRQKNKRKWIRQDKEKPGAGCAYNFLPCSPLYWLVLRKSYKQSQEWWHRPVIPALIETGGW
jgi:hypothetical protein